MTTQNRPQDTEPKRILPESFIAGTIDDEDLSFEEYKEELRGTDSKGTIKVYRLPEDEIGNPLSNTKGHSILFTCEVDQFTFEELCAKIRREYIRPGRNNIWVRIIGTRRGNRPGAPFSKIVNIESPNTGGSQEGVGDIAAVLRAVQESSAQQMASMREAFREMLASQARPVAPTAPPQDPIETSIKMITAMTGMMSALQSTNSPRQAMATGGSLLEQIETLKALKGFAKDLMGPTARVEKDDDADDTITGVITSVSPLAMKLLDVLKSHQQSPQYPANARLPPPPGQALPGPGNAAPAPAPVDAPSAEDKQSKSKISEANMLAFLRPQLETLAQMASEGADVKAVAELTLKALPDSFDDQLCVFLEEEGWFDKLAAINPKIKDSRDWFMNLKAALLAEFEDDGK